MPAEMNSWPWYDSKWNITSQYKFILAFENSVYEDYVSEKLYHAFIVGSIPGMTNIFSNLFLIKLVYWGAPNVHEFLPSDHSIIDVNDFKFVILFLN